MAGKLGDHRGGDAGVGPLHVLAPAVLQRQRHGHVAQQHRHVDRGVADQREPKRDQRVGVDIQRQCQVHRDRLAEDVLADLDRQHGGVQRDDLARPVHHHVLGGGLHRGGGTQVALPGAAWPKPLGPHHPQRLVGRQLHARPEPLPHVLMDQPLPGPHADLGAVQRLSMDRMDRFADLLADAMPTPAAQPPPIDAADWAEAAVVGGKPPQGPFADILESQEPGLLPAERTKLRRPWRATAPPGSWPPGHRPGEALPAVAVGGRRRESRSPSRADASPATEAGRDGPPGGPPGWPAAGHDPRPAVRQPPPAGSAGR